MEHMYVKIWDGTALIDIEFGDVISRLLAEVYYGEVTVSELILSYDCPAVEVFFDDQATDIVVWWG